MFMKDNLLTIGEVIFWLISITIFGLVGFEIGNTSENLWKLLGMLGAFSVICLGIIIYIHITNKKR